MRAEQFAETIGGYIAEFRRIHGHSEWEPVTVIVPYIPTVIGWVPPPNVTVRLVDESAMRGTEMPFMMVRTSDMTQQALALWESAQLPVVEDFGDD